MRRPLSRAQDAFEADATQDQAASPTLQARAGFKVEAITDLHSAVDGADVVVDWMGIGGLDATRADSKARRLEVCTADRSPRSG